MVNGISFQGVRGLAAEKWLPKSSQALQGFGVPTNSLGAQLHYMLVVPVWMPAPLWNTVVCFLTSTWRREKAWSAMRVEAGTWGAKRRRIPHHLSCQTHTNIFDTAHWEFYSRCRGVELTAEAFEKTKKAYRKIVENLENVGKLSYQEYTYLCRRDLEKFTSWSAFSFCNIGRCFEPKFTFFPTKKNMFLLQFWEHGDSKKVGRFWPKKIKNGKKLTKSLVLGEKSGPRVKFL